MTKISNADVSWQFSVPSSKQFNDPYFSLADGLAETEYVFLQQNDLPQLWRGKSNFVIAETGFGTGLNFLVTADRWIKTADENAQLTFFSVEKYPLSRQDLEKATSNWPQFGAISQDLLNAYPENLPGFYVLPLFNERITLVLMLGDVLPMLVNMNSKVDCWYLDGFSPAKNPEMWTYDVCQQIARLSKNNTRFSTFTAASLVRKNLQAVGFEIHKKPGYGKKREMLCGKYVGDSSDNHQNYPWFSLENTRQPNVEEVVIVGGGLAGLSCAWMLARRNVSAVLFEAKSDIAAGASGNPAGIVMPRISLDMNLVTQFYLSSFFYSIDCYDYLKQCNSNLLWFKTGVLQLMDQCKLDRINALDLPAAFIQILSSQQASDLAQINIKDNSLLFPQAGYVNPFQVCNVLLESNKKNIKVNTNSIVETIKRENDCWRLYDDKNCLLSEAKTIIFANGYDAKRLLNLEFLPLTKSRGQLSEVTSQEVMKSLKLPICKNGYVIPEVEGSHHFGATYNFLDHEFVSEQDHLSNIQSVESIIGEKIEIDLNDLKGRVSFRTTSLDHLPVVGPIPNELNYQSDYTSLQHGRLHEKFESATYLPSLYISSGHGSRGLVSCFAAANYLTSLITNSPIHLPENIAHLLHPGRFLIRKLKKGATNH